MVEEAQEEHSSHPSQAGPSEVENHTITHMDVSDSRRAAQLIGRQLAQIGDVLNRGWRVKPPNPRPRHFDWQIYRNMLTWRAINGRMVGRIWWSKVMPTARANCVVSHVHTRACQATMKWLNWVCSHIPDWPGTSNCFLTSAVLLITAAAFTATWKMYKN